MRSGFHATFLLPISPVFGPERTSDMPVRDPQQEIFDVCDAADEVIGQASRAEVHARQLLHRAVHVWVFRSDGSLLVQLRSPTKDEYPSTFTSSASGHLDAGEDYPTAARRELLEELGLALPLEFIVKLPAAPATACEHTTLFVTKSDARPQPEADEISEVFYRPIEELLVELHSAPEHFSPPFRELLLWWSTHRTGGVHN